MKVNKRKAKRPSGYHHFDEYPDQKLNSVLQNGVDLERRIIYLNGEIEEGSAYRFLVGLMALDTSPGIITVVMNSCGGSCTDGFAIYDALKFAKNEIIIVGFGQVASMATIIFQAAHRRVISPECEFMIHETITGQADSVSYSYLQTIQKNIARIEARANKILVEASGQSLEQIERWNKEETTFTAEEAVRYGFADEILIKQAVKTRR